MIFGSLICSVVGHVPKTYYYKGEKDRPLTLCDRCGGALGLWAHLAPWPDCPVRAVAALDPHEDVPEGIPIGRRPQSAQSRHRVMRRAKVVR